MKKFIVLLNLTILLFCGFFPNGKISGKSVFADDIKEKTYIVYDDNNNFILELQSVTEGDIIINRSYQKFIITYVDNDENFALCRYVETLEKPTLKKNFAGFINQNTRQKYIGMYCSHNDESYETGDGTSSVYGPGGIHDVAKKLCLNLQDDGINVIFDPSLHIPHDAYAYSRSSVTAKSLLKDYPLDAIFDIHRDGASRKLYVKTVDGKERSKVRIVVGQANPNKADNLEFALYLMRVSEIICPWLFLDIYYAKGHYNQALSPKSLLFEMGSHLVEKDLVMETTKYLADVINAALYYTHINEDGELIVTSLSSPDPALTDYFDEKSSSADSDRTVLAETNAKTTDTMKPTPAQKLFGKLTFVLVISLLVTIIIKMNIKKFLNKKTKNKI